MGARPFRTEAEDRPGSPSGHSTRSHLSEHSERVPVAVEPALSFVVEEPPSRKPTIGASRTLDLYPSKPLVHQNISSHSFFDADPPSLLPDSPNEKLPPIPIELSPQTSSDNSPSPLLIEDDRLVDSPPPLSPQLLPPEPESDSTTPTAQPLPSVPTPRFAPAVRPSEIRQSSYLRQPTGLSSLHPSHRPGSIAVQPPAERWDSRAKGFGGFPNPLLQLGKAVVPQGMRHRFVQPARTMTLLSGTIDRREEGPHEKKRRMEAEAKQGLTK